jgi:Protein of unknown function (DUF3261)
MTIPVLRSALHGVGRLGLAFLILAGCGTVSPRDTGEPLAQDEALIAPHLRLKIPRPQALNQTATITQSVVAHYRDATYSFEANIALAPDSLELVALDGMGRRALTITWSGNNLRYQPALWLPPSLRPSNILADMTIAYWPDRALRAALAEATITTTSQRRTISANGADIVVVEYGSGTGWNRSAHFRNLAFGYSLDIQSVQFSP